MTEFSVPPGLSDIADGYDAIFCDVWGVIHNGRQAFDPACQALQAFRAQGKPVVLLTNAPVQAEHVVSVFPRVGVPMDCFDDVASSGDATRAVIDARAPGPAFRMGTDEGWEKDDMLFEGSGLAFSEADEAAFIVCMGLRDQVHDHPDDYRGELAAHVERGLEMVCANPDIQVRVGDRLLWCAGALAAIYEELGGRVIYPGKPYAPIYDLAKARLADHGHEGIADARILCIGDGPVTDIRGANAQGLDVLYVGTGLHQAGQDFTAETNTVFQKEGVYARYAMPHLQW